MLDRVVRAALGTVSRADVLVISPDQDRWQKSAGSMRRSFHSCKTRNGRGSIRRSSRQPISRVKWACRPYSSLPADLPLVTSADIDNVLRRDAPVVIAPDRHRMGTNALMVRLDAFGEPFVFQFGEGSFGEHQDEAGRLGVDAVTATSLGTSFDLDTPEDLTELEVFRSPSGVGRAAR
ncbi:MAG: hypothetical protein R2848_16640 [Thermomicrobiales bacterium]